jgi:SecD/SecF fusion protein
MQNKGAIKFLAIALAVVCLYQLSFTFVAYKVQRDAREYAQGDYNKEFAYLDSIAGDVVFNLGIRKFTFREVQDRQINLGLDLKGGMNVTLEVSVADIIRALSNYSTDTTFTRAMEIASQNQRFSQEDFINLFGRAFQQVDPNGKLAAIFSTVDLRDRIPFTATNDEVLNVLRTETEGAIDNSFNILRTRIDRFGVVQPNIQKLENQGRILVELPGVKEPARVRKLLQGTANLEFWETYENSEMYQFLLDANSRIKEIEDARSSAIAPADTLSSGAVDTTTETLADTTSSEVSLLDQLAQEQPTADDDSLDRGEMIKDFPLFSVLQPSVGRDNTLVPGSVIGMAHARDTAKVNAYFAMNQIRTLFPRDVKFLWGVKSPKWDNSETFFELHAIKMTGRDGRAPLDGGVVTNARAEFGQNQATAEVSMTMNAEGAKVWARMTKDNVSRCIAIVLDNAVYSAPRVNAEIKGGNSSITGDFTINEAQDLSNVLKSGKLPAPARIMHEDIVGPSLGQEAIQAGFGSFLIAFIVVLIYMIFYYNRAGWIADLALVSNVFFIMGVLASLGAVLTLPGIAGIVLTMGMAVDANVIIYERIREEIRAGKGVKLAIADGYRNAYSAIIDGNVTTLLTGVVLFIFGTGPIQGFATTLIIGILTSLFSAIFITRLVFEGLMTKNKVVKFSNKITENILQNANYDFIGKRKFFYVLSAIVILVGVGSIFTRGFNLGVDFTGGRTYVVRFDDKVSTVQLAKDLEVAFGTTPEVKTYGSDRQVKITTKYMIDVTDPAIDVDSIVETKLYEGLQPALGAGVSFEDFIDNYRQSSQKVGPTIADDIKVAAFWSILFALVGIFMYIFIRFKNWRYGLGGVIALFHDTFLILGLFSLLYFRLPFSLEIDQAFIAAILTIIGYSINDTVIIFDRIREYFTLYPKRDRLEVYNSALNSTLGRTLNTAVTTAFVLLAIFLFGGEVIRGFVFALLIGIIVGTYSSLFIATPIVYDSNTYRLKRLAAKKK